MGPLLTICSDIGLQQQSSIIITMIIGTLSLIALFLPENMLLAII